MSILLVFLVVMTILIGNCIYAIETSIFYSAKSALNHSLIELSIDSQEVIDSLNYAIDPERLVSLVQQQLAANSVYMKIQLSFYFYNQSTMQECVTHNLVCDGVQIQLQAHSTYFTHKSEVRFEVSIGG